MKTGRITQYLLITLAIAGIASFYLYINSTASTKINSSQEMKLTDGLVGYWTFDGNHMDWSATGAEALDQVGSNDGGVTNATVVEGKIGQALQFDGTGDYVSGVNANVTGLDTITLSAWIKRSGASSTGYEAVIETTNSDENGHFLDANCGDNLIHFGYVIDYTTTAVTISNSLVADGDWHYLTGVYDRGAGKLYIYVDGVERNNANASADVIGGNRMIVGGGAGYTGCSGWHDNKSWFNGVIDEPRIYNRALTQTEISELYNQGQAKINASQETKLTDGLVGHWTFDGNHMDWSQSTAEARDQSGQGNDGDVIGATAMIGKVGQALDFDGTNDYISVGNINSKGYAFSFWAYFSSQITSASGCGDLIRYGPTLGQDSIIIGSCSGYATNETLMIMDYDGGTYHRTYIRDTISSGWHHIVINWNSGSSQYKFTIDNDAKEPVYAGSFGNTLLQDIDDLNIGANNNYVDFNGLIDEIRIYNRALAQDEISQLYNQGQAKINASQETKLTDGLVGNWTFDGNHMDWGATGAEVLDQGTGGNDGAVTGLTNADAVIGKVGQALNFDGSGDYVEIGTDLGSNDIITINFWIKPSASQQNGILSSGPTLNMPRIYVELNTDYTIDLYRGSYVTSDATISSTDWTFVSLINNGSDTTFYFNGIFDKTVGQLTSINTQSVFYIGNGYQGYFNGQIDEVRIYNRALSADEISQLYMMGK